MTPAPFSMESMELAMRDQRARCKSCGKALHSCPCPDLVAGGVIPAALRFLAGLLGMGA